MNWNSCKVKHNSKIIFCLFNIYIQMLITVASSHQAVDNPTYAEVRDVCAAAGLTIGVEVR